MAKDEATVVNTFLLRLAAEELTPCQILQNHPQQQSRLSPVLMARIKDALENSPGRGKTSKRAKMWLCNVHTLPTCIILQSVWLIQSVRIWFYRRGPGSETIS